MVKTQCGGNKNIKYKCFFKMPDDKGIGDCFEVKFVNKKISK